MTAPSRIASTSDLTPAGVLGYAKGLAAGLAFMLGALAILLPDTWQAWAQALIALLGAISVVVVPNKVQPVAVHQT